jgi:hypothetical protein
MTTVLQALRAVMNEVPSVAKLDRNDQSNYAFRGVDAVVDAVAPALRKHGIVVAPQLISAEYTTVTVGKNRTEMSSVRLQVRFVWYGPDGDQIESSVAAESFDSGDKATAKAHSVAYRTALIETLCLATKDRDPDKDTYERSPALKPSAADAARQDLLKLLGDIDVDPTEAAEKFMADGHGDIAQSTNSRAIRSLIAHYKTIAGRA